jgi:preprotein translocase subunit SecG
MLFGILLFIFVVVCILLCFLILIQSDKGGGISGAIGGGFAGATNMFGAQDTANVLTKMTTGLAIAFGGLCIIMSLFVSHPSGKQTKSMLQERAGKQQNFSPASVLQGQQALPLAPANAAAGSQKAELPQTLPLAPAAVSKDQGSPKSLPLQQAPAANAVQKNQTLPKSLPIQQTPVTGSAAQKAPAEKGKQR